MPDWSKFPEHLWIVANYFFYALLIFLIIGLVLFCLVVAGGYIYEGILDIGIWIESKWRRRKRKETPGHKTYKQQGGPW